ncbi:MAG: hypothetical protein AVDCRST_MAG02-2886, partial [uncultured Rubrobacteraceae bacterium]
GRAGSVAPGTLPRLPRRPDPGLRAGQGPGAILVPRRGPAPRGGGRGRDVTRRTGHGRSLLRVLPAGPFHGRRCWGRLARRSGFGRRDILLDLRHPDPRTFPPRGPRHTSPAGGRREGRRVGRGKGGASRLRPQPRRM